MGSTTTLRATERGKVRQIQWRRQGALALLLASVSMGRAGELMIESLRSDGELVFRTSDAGTTEHTYRVECATSLASAVWTTVRTVGGVGAAASVTNPVALQGDAAFYRVIATSNLSSFVDGPYMVIDVSGGAAATNYPVAHYGSSVDVPGGVTNDVYKTSSILLRRIPAGAFTMGSPTNELGHWNDETRHPVTLTKDFYLGVFEVTQKQWQRVMGTWPSYFHDASCRDTRPVEQASYYDIRENPANSDDAAVDWPNNRAVNADSFMGRLRAKTGLATLDLPTESQWEYACRAGTGTALDSGKNLTNVKSCPNMSEVGRYWYNGGSNYAANGDTSGGTAKVGSYLPNQWGLYDMHGNVWEWCLDWYATYPGTATDPAGAASGSTRVKRGGNWSDDAGACRSAFRSSSSPSNQYANFGLRLSWTLP